MVQVIIKLERPQILEVMNDLFSNNSNGTIAMTANERVLIY